MKKITTKPMLSWILWQPLKFAVISFVLMVIAGIISTLIANTEETAKIITTILLLISFISAIAIMFWRMPRDNIDRRSFVALTNTQVILASILFFISIILATSYYDWIILKMMWLNAHSNTYFSIIMSIIGLYFMYICGLFLSSLYTKYRRCRAMGIAPWKIICSMPFGFSMLWAPGYILPDNHTPNYVVPIRAKWYEKFTNWITSHTIITCLSFIIMVGVSQFFFGYKSVLLTLILTTIFAIWLGIVGDKNFRRSISGKYANFAIIINAVLLVGIIAYKIFSQPTIQLI